MMTAAYDEIINFCLDADRVIVKVGDLLTKVMVQFVTNEVQDRSATWKRVHSDVTLMRPACIHGVLRPCRALPLPT